MFFAQTRELTDSELAREIELLPVMKSKLLGNERVSQFIQDELINYQQALFQEKQRRDDIVYPLESFGVTDWFK